MRAVVAEHNRVKPRGTRHGASRQRHQGVVHTGVVLLLLELGGDPVGVELGLGSDGVVEVGLDFGGEVDEVSWFAAGGDIDCSLL